MNNNRIQSPFSLWHRLGRLVYTFVWSVAGRPLSRSCFSWRRWLLGCFGADIAPSARVYGSVVIWCPKNLTMGPNSILAEHVECYNVAPVTMEEGSIVSQQAYLCTAGHDIHDPTFPLVSAPITLQKDSWICAKAVVGMGVTVGEGAVVGLGAVVVKSVEPWTIVGGNPARVIGCRRHDTL